MPVPSTLLQAASWPQLMSNCIISLPFSAFGTTCALVFGLQLYTFTTTFTKNKSCKGGGGGGKAALGARGVKKKNLLERWVPPKKSKKSFFAQRILVHTYRCVGSELVQPELGPLTRKKILKKISQQDYLEAQKNPWKNKKRWTKKIDKKGQKNSFPRKTIVWTNKMPNIVKFFRTFIWSPVMKQRTCARLHIKRVILLHI